MVSALKYRLSVREKLSLGALTKSLCTRIVHVHSNHKEVS